MFAIVEIQGKQYKVTEKDTIEVDTLNQEKGKVSFDTVLLYSKDGKSVDIGTPYLNGAKVDAEIIENKRGKKLRVFKMKAKKRYSVTIGHRQNLSVLEIKKITAGKSTPAASKKTEEPKAEPETEKKEA